MKRALTRIIALSMALLFPSAALAAGIASPSYQFILVGGDNLVKNGNNGWSCQWIFKMQTGPSVGGNPPRAAGGTLTGGTAGVDTCTVMTIAPSTFTITSSNVTGGTDVFNGLTFRQSGVSFCSTTNQVPFQYLNDGDAPSDVFFDSATIGTNYGATTDRSAPLGVS